MFHAAEASAVRSIFHTAVHFLSTMPRGTSLTTREQGEIDGLLKLNKSLSFISKQLNRSHFVVKRYADNPKAYNINNRKGRPPKLSPAARRLLLREASKGQLTSNALRKELNLPIKARTVRTILHKAVHLKYKKMRTAPKLTLLHKLARVKFAEQHVTWTVVQWSRVIFSDEKKFNLDGPDGNACYWHDLRHDERIFSTRQQGGGSLMVWGAFSFEGKARLAFIHGRQNSQKYVETLSEYLLPFAAEHYGANWTFQQDGASIHTSKLAKAWFNNKNMDVMPWPAKSPDLNPIENLWSILARRVYANFRQFNTVADLKECITKEWNNIQRSTLTHLIESMSRRCVAVLRKNGGNTSY